MHAGVPQKMRFKECHMTKPYIALWPFRQRGLGTSWKCFETRQGGKTEECTEDKHFFVVQTEILSLFSLMGHKYKQWSRFSPVWKGSCWNYALLCTALKQPVSNEEEYSCRNVLGRWVPRSNTTLENNVSWDRDVFEQKIKICESYTTITDI